MKDTLRSHRDKDLSIFHRRQFENLSKLIKNLSKLIECAGRSITAISLSFLISCDERKSLLQNETVSNQIHGNQRKAAVEKHDEQFALIDQELARLLIDLLDKTPLVFSSLEDLKKAVSDLHGLFQQHPELVPGALNMAFVFGQNANPNNEYCDIGFPRSSGNGGQLHEAVRRAEGYYRAQFLQLGITTHTSSIQSYEHNDQSKKSGNDQSKNSLAQVVISKFPQLLTDESLNQITEENRSARQSSPDREGLKKENFLQQLLRRLTELGNIKDLDPDYRVALLLGCIDDFLNNFDGTLVNVSPRPGIPSPKEAEINKTLIAALTELSQKEIENLSSVVNTLSNSQLTTPRHKSLLEKISKYTRLFKMSS